MKKRVFIVLLIFTTIGWSIINAQDKSITGTVSSFDDGLPLPGVTIVAKGTSIGTITNADGQFSINVPAETEFLVFSFVGMKSQEVRISDQQNVQVVMEQDILGLDEVVVTAVGIRRNSRSISYSVQKIDGDEVENKVETDVLRSLSGRIAGVNITNSGGAAGSSTNITIRGSSSALGSNQPLFVVDGIPYDNTTFSTQNLSVYGSTYSNRALDLDPNDIESISVLKSGSAAALYGSRAANGVIIITTKSGNNSDERKMNVSFTSTLAMEEPTKLPEYQNEYGQGANFQFNSGYFGTWGPRFDAPDLDGNGDGIGSGLLFLNNNVPSYVSHIGDTVPYKAYPNNVKDFFEKGMVFENSLSITGGDENTNYILSVTSNNQDGFIPHTQLDKYSVKVAGNQKIGKKARFGGSITYTRTDQLGVPIGGYGVTNVNIFGQLWLMPRSYDLSGFPYIDPVTKESIHYRTDRDNPYYIAQENTYSSKVDRMFGYIDAEFNIADWLTLSYKMGWNSYTDRRKQVYAKSTLFNDRLGSIITDDIAYTELESNLLLRMDKTFNKFNITAIAGWNINQITIDRQSLQGNEIIVHGINDLDNTKTVLPNGGDYEQRRLSGLFADVTFGYANWAFINLTGRNDWSSTLPVESNNYFYPGITGSVIVSDAIPALDNSILSYLKLYGGISKIGNDADVYLTASTFEVNPSWGNNLGQVSTPFNGTAALAAGDLLGNNNLKPEFTTEYEIGLDFGFLNNKIGVDLTYYNRVSTDQIFAVQIPASTGYIQKVMNAGKITNEGMEVALTGTPVFRQGGLRWDIALNYSRNISKVVELFEGVDLIDVGVNYTNLGNVHQVGYPYGVVQGTVFRRDDEGNLLINSTTGYAMADTELGIIADPNPDYISSLSNKFRFKGLLLSVLVEFRKGGELYSYTIDELRGRGVVPETADNREAGRIIRGYFADPDNPSEPLLVDGEKVPNNIQITTNDYFFRGFPAAEANVYDVTTLRLREVVLGYSLPKKWLNKTPIQDLTISLIGRNLWFYAPNIPHIDPETSGYAAGNRQGIDYYYMPNARRYAISLKVNF
ncbi:MAG: SusC/RagA family TonB-linked outer membrane protein [Bacteroidales bacterium]|nr:SusC/RagA family TonB-linked outer membrane protein [Bacteroidales bacterium]